MSRPTTNFPDWWGEEGLAVVTALDDTLPAYSAKAACEVAFVAGRESVIRTISWSQAYWDEHNRLQRRLDETALQLYVALLNGRGQLYDSGELRKKSYDLAKKFIAEGQKEENQIK